MLVLEFLYRNLSPFLWASPTVYVILGFSPSETSVTTVIIDLAASTSFYLLGRKVTTWKPLHSSTLHIILRLFYQTVILSCLPPPRLSMGLKNMWFVLSFMTCTKHCTKCYDIKSVKSLSFAIRLNLIWSWPDHFLDVWPWTSDLIVFKHTYKMVITPIYRGVMGIKWTYT